MGDPIDFSFFCGPNPEAENHTLTVFLGDGKDVGRADGKGAETIEMESGFGPVHPSIVVTILGAKGKDKIIGHRGDGTLTGGVGRDKIKDKGGNDLIKTGPGKDKVKAKDGDADLIVCDRRDTIKADAADTLRGC